MAFSMSSSALDANERIVHAWAQRVTELEQVKKCFCRVHILDLFIKI
jgi:hypothetical protein